MQNYYLKCLLTVRIEEAPKTHPFPEIERSPCLVFPLQREGD